MPDEEHHRYDQENPTEEHAFDKLAKALASRGISRGRALTLVGTAIVGGFLGIFALPDESEAKKKKGKAKGKGKAKKKSKCQKGEVFCHGRCCIPGSVCCEGIGESPCIPNNGSTCCPGDLVTRGSGFCGPLEFCCEFSCCPKEPGVICGPDPQIPCITV